MKFLDTYALIELLRGNPRYERFEEEEWCTLAENLAELAYALLKEGRDDVVEETVQRLGGRAVQLPTILVVAAMRFRHEQRRKKFSYIDALGYTYARKQKIAFVTGDSAFKGLEGVEFKQ